MPDAAYSSARSGRAGGRRHYGAASAERVALIQLCRDAGFTLREIRALVAAGSRKTRSWTRLVEAKLRELEARVAQAERAKALVEHALACPHRNLLGCSNFRAAIKAHLGSPAKNAGAACIARTSARVTRPPGPLAATSPSAMPRS